MSAPQIDDAPADLGGIRPPDHIPQVGDAEPWPPGQATVTALPNAEDTGPIEVIADPAHEDETESEAEGTNEDTVPSLSPPVAVSAPAPRMVWIAPVERERPAAQPAPAEPDRAATTRNRPEAAPAAFWSRVGEIARNFFGFGDRGTGNGHVPGVSVFVLGVLTSVTATAAFTLSFQMILPLVVAAGWTPPIAYLGPVVIDITEVAAAVMGVLAKRDDFSRTGRLFLIMATFLSIVLNLAGHQLRSASPGAIHSTVPPGWAWAIELFSVMVPVILAINIHLFGTAFSAWLEQRRRHKEKQLRQQRRQNANAATKPATSGDVVELAPSRPAAQHTGVQSEEEVLSKIVDYAIQHGKGFRMARNEFLDYVNVPTEARVKRALAKRREVKNAAS